MAPPRTEKLSKRRRNRKARTEVSSDSSSNSSSSDAEAQSPPPAQKQKKPKRQTKASDRISPDVHSDKAGGDDHFSASSPDASPTVATQPSAEGRESAQSFEQFYLAQATREFATDLEKLRHAGDWRGERSLEGLVRGLKQGVGCFEGGARAGEFSKARN